MPAAQQQTPEILVNTRLRACPEFPSRGSERERGPAVFVCVVGSSPASPVGVQPPAVLPSDGCVWGGPAPLPPVPTHHRQSSGCCFPHCWNSTPVCLLVPVWFQTPSSFSLFFFNLFPFFPFTTHLLYMQRAPRLSSSNKIPEATTVWFGFYGDY